MVFAKFNMSDMNGIEIMRESKQKLSDEIPIFNIFAENLAENEMETAYNIVGKKLNALVDEDDQERIVDILERYKEYKEHQNK